jgi:urate oxidase
MYRENVVKLIDHNYGKAGVRVLKVFRTGRSHSVKELEVQVMLQGDFDASFTKADNRLVVATDSMKNIVNVLAKRELGEETEEFGLMLAQHFLKTYQHVRRVEIHLAEHCWGRIAVGGRPHAHAFSERNAAKPFAKIVATRNGSVVESGIEDLLIMKTTASGFEKFWRDEFTTLPDTGDRIFATKLKATWTYAQEPRSYAKTNGKILEAMLAVFAQKFSPSVQVTLFQMGEAALKAGRHISQIHIAMPNKHCPLVNLKPFGLENRNELFVPTDEPHGQIEGTIARR